MDAFMDQMKQENKNYNQVVQAASVFGSSPFNPYPASLSTQGTEGLSWSFSPRYSYCSKHGYISSWNGFCPSCFYEQQASKPQNDPYKLAYTLTKEGDIEMAKKVLTTEQKAAITYGRARGLTDTQIIDLYAVAKLTPGNIDDMISFAKLLEDYDPSEDDEDDS